MTGFSFAQQRAEIEEARVALLAQAAELTTRAAALEQAAVWLHHADGTADDTMAIEDLQPAADAEPTVDQLVDGAAAMASTAARARQILDERKGKPAAQAKAKAEPVVCPDCGKEVPSARGLAVHRGLKHPPTPVADRLSNIDHHTPAPAGPVADALAILDQAS